MPTSPAPPLLNVGGWAVSASGRWRPVSEHEQTCGRADASQFSLAPPWRSSTPPCPAGAGRGHKRQSESWGGGWWGTEARLATLAPIQMPVRSCLLRLHMLLHAPPIARARIRLMLLRTYNAAAATCPTRMLLLGCTRPHAPAATLHRCWLHTPAAACLRLPACCYFACCLLIKILATWSTPQHPSKTDETFRTYACNKCA
jgi:hypothetical protein